MKPVLKGIKSYFSDKKNRVVHMIVGISGVIATIFSLIGFYDRIMLFGVAICFNVLRMRLMPWFLRTLTFILELSSLFTNQISN